MVVFTKADLRNSETIAQAFKRELPAVPPPTVEDVYVAFAKALEEHCIPDAVGKLRELIEQRREWAEASRAGKDAKNRLLMEAAPSFPDERGVSKDQRSPDDGGRGR